MFMHYELNSTVYRYYHYFVGGVPVIVIPSTCICTWMSAIQKFFKLTFLVFLNIFICELKFLCVCVCVFLPSSQRGWRRDWTLCWGRVWWATVTSTPSLLTCRTGPHRTWPNTFSCSSTHTNQPKHSTLMVVMVTVHVMHILTCL